MTSPPRPEWLWKQPGRCWDTVRGDEVRAYITYLERELESCQAALDRARERPDPDSWHGP